MLLLPDKLTSREARDTLRMLAQALPLDTDASVVVDAAGLKQFDSAALAVLLECQRLAQAAGKPFVVRHIPNQLNALARLYGVDVLLAPALATDTAPPATA